MKVPFCKCCYKEVGSRFSVSSGLVYVVKEGYSDTISVPLYDNLSILLSWTEIRSVFCRGVYS